MGPRPDGLPLPTGLDGVTLDLLSRIVQEVLARTPEEEPPVEIERVEHTVEDKVASLHALLAREREVSFRAFISACRTRLEIIVSFMAVLELIKGLRLRAQQDAAFGDITLVSVEPADEARAAEELEAGTA
jgi:segregation and condensation protein A